VLTEADFERCAALMIELPWRKRRRAGCPTCSELRELGERDASEIWMRVKVTIERLQGKSPATLINRQSAVARQARA